MSSAERLLADVLALPLEVGLVGAQDVPRLGVARKDLHFAHQMGREFGVPLELAGLTEQIFARARATYGGSAQSPMVVKLLEEAVGTDLRAPGFPAELAPE
jgi:3-hydroxyisobutyrate dehydrogenase